MRLLLLFIVFLSSINIEGSCQTDSIGIYTKNGLITSKIEPIKYSRFKTNTLGSALTMGIASSKIKLIFDGECSQNLANVDTEFYFYFSNNSIVDNINKYFMFINSSSPSDFALAKFKVKNNKRELETGKVNIYSGTELGVMDNINALIDVVKINEGVYKVSIKGNIDPGEYCFYYNAQAASGAYLPVFDFRFVEK